MRPVMVVIPCFNEATRLDTAAFRSAMQAHPQIGLLFVDDGSEDETVEVLNALCKQLGPDRASILRLETNVGKAEAVRRGITAVCEGDHRVTAPHSVGYWDADLSTPLEYAARFSAVLDDRPETLAVIGSRVKLMGRHVERRVLRHYSGRVFATLASMALGFAVYDTQCGAKLFRATDDVLSVFRRPFQTRWAFDVELLARIAAIHGNDIGDRGKVVEYPLETWVDVPGSKVKALDLPRMIMDLMRVYFRYGRPTDAGGQP